MQQPRKTLFTTVAQPVHWFRGLSLKWRMIILYVLLYLGYCLMMYFMQGSMIFPAALAQPDPSQPYPDGEKLTLDTDAGTVHAWYLPVTEANASTPAPLVVYVHGNAETAGNQSDVVRLYHMLGVSVLLPEYRGYAGCPGTPREGELVSDAVAFTKQVLSRPEVDAETLYLHGRSIGGFIAAQAAVQLNPKGLILQSTGTSLVRRTWHYGLPPFLLQSPFRTDRVLPNLEAKVLVIHSKDDHIFSLKEGRTLATLADAEIHVYDGGHNSPLPLNYASWIRDFVTTPTGPKN
jgi:fermentation-respiration switch protein FrsA (DUF1100 family)